MKRGVDAVQQYRKHLAGVIARDVLGCCWCGTVCSLPSLADGHTAAKQMLACGDGTVATQSGTEGLSLFLEGAPPSAYFLYLMAAGCGLPCSEDALVVWLGARIFRGHFTSWMDMSWTMCVVYLGVVLSDLWTYTIGAALRRGLLKRLDRMLFKDSARLQMALEKVQQWGGFIGLVQRFSVGIRGPLCLMAGFTGVPFWKFSTGAALGAVVTMTLQVWVGGALRDAPNVYLTALALVAGPSMVGWVAGPLATACGFWVASKRWKEQQEELRQASASGGDDGACSEVLPAADSSEDEGGLEGRPLALT